MGDPGGARVVSVGARGPLGLSATQVAMCGWAGKLEPRSCDLLDKRGREMGDARTPGLPDDLYGVARVEAMGAAALCEAWRNAGDRWREPVPLLLATAERGRPGDDPALDGRILDELARVSGAPIDRSRSLVIRAGHAGGGIALQLALERLASGDGAVVVGGVDTYHHPEALRWLDHECRLHALEAEDGFIPGEGAAFLLLAPGSRRKGEIRVAAAASARETDDPNLAMAMTDMAQKLLGEPSTVGWVLTDNNGERHRLREWTKVHARIDLPAGAVHTRIPELLGDVGAATGPMAAAIAVELWRLGYSPATSALVALHADGPERAAFLLKEHA